MKNLGQGTLCVQGGYKPKNGEPRAVPIIQSTTFKYDTCEAIGDLFDLKASGYFYSRLQNPTNDNVAAKICELEGGSAAMLTSSGQAACFFSVFNLAGCGDHVVCSSAVYGGTYNLFNVTMRKMGVDFTFVDPDCTEEELNAAFKPNTKLVYGETLSNPTLNVLDIEKFSNAAHAHGVPMIVDNTFATPINCKPFDFGVDIIVHSTTKYMDGHASGVGGAIVDKGEFDWAAHADKFPAFNEPDESYHGVIYAEAFGNAGAYITKCTVQLMRDLGAIQAPQNAFLVNVGLESLHVRMAKHCENALAVAKALEASDKVESVNFPGLEGNKYHSLAQKYMNGNTCGVLSFRVKGGREAALEFMKHLELGTIETHVAEARTCCIHPASTTHRQLTDAELEEAEIYPNLVRFSCGLEDAEDLVADVQNALSFV